MLDEINSIVDASAMELDIQKSLEFSTLSLKDFLKKIHYGGRIYLMGNDLDSIMIAYNQLKITGQQLRELLYNGRQQCFTISEVVGELESNGFKVIEKILNNFQYAIKAERNVNNV